MTDRPVRVGVIGTGSMGKNHARVYRELQSTELVGIHDTDSERMAEVAETFETEPRSFAELLGEVEAASIAVPTEHHYQAAQSCIEAGLDILVEKPFVDSVQRGEQLVDFAETQDVTIQVGHIERFNPAVEALFSLEDDLELIGVEARRLSPPTDRPIDQSVVLDLMIHDIDLLLQLLGSAVELSAHGTDDGEYATATFESTSGQLGRLTASRVTQEKVRKLTLTTVDSRIVVDFINQAIDIRRQSVPEYVRKDGSVNYRHETVVENLVVENREPLKNQLASFASAVRGEHDPAVSGQDGLRAVELAQRIEGLIDVPRNPRPAVKIH